MTIKTTVVIPWRSSGNRERDMSLEFCIRDIRRNLPEARVILADSWHEPFNRSASRNLGVRQAASGVVVACDADTLYRGDLRAVVEAAAGNPTLHTPFDEYWALSEEGLEQYVLGVNIEQCDASPYHASQGAMYVMQVESWLDSGGMDESLVGWGFEDPIFQVVARTLYGPTVRHPGSVYHLWHPVSWSAQDESYQHNLKRCQLYEAYDGDREAILRLQGM